MPESSPLTPLRREASTSQNILGNNDVTLKRGREMRSIPDRAMCGSVASGVLPPCTLHGEMKEAGAAHQLFYFMIWQQKTKVRPVFAPWKSVQVILEGAYGRVTKLTISLENIFT